MAFAGLCLALGVPAPLAGQGAQREPAPTVIPWWEGAAVLGGLALSSAFDEAIHHATQESRSRFGDDLAAIARRPGQPEVFATIPGAMFLAGAITGRPALRRSGARVAGSLALAGVLVTAGKLTFGRLRPSQVEEPYEWRPFSGADAFPSGHTTMAFALATSLANEIRRPWATVGLMVVAAGTGWSRLNDNKHWVSDVAAGATLGVTSAQLIDGRWTLFHLRPPAVFLTPGRAGVAWRVSARLP